MSTCCEGFMKAATYIFFVVGRYVGCVKYKVKERKARKCFTSQGDKDYNRKEINAE